MRTFGDELAARLRWYDGHSDTLGLFADAAFLRRAAAAVANPFRDAGVQKVAGIEARGFVLAAGVAPADRSLGGVYAGLSLLVDQLHDAVRDELRPVAAVALAADVGG